MHSIIDFNLNSLSFHDLVFDYKLDVILDFMINFIADTLIVDDVIYNTICKVMGQNYFVVFGVP